MKTPQKIFLKDYTSPAFEIEKCFLSFQIFDDYTDVQAKTEFKKKRNGDPLVLNGIELKLLDLKINGRPLGKEEYHLDAEHLTIPETQQSFTLETSVRIFQRSNTALEGLYCSNSVYATQCEAQGFRRITYFMDRPDVMTSFTVQIEANKKSCPFLLSNGDCIEKKDIGNGRHMVLWQDPHRKPCYLFALVAGDLGVIYDRFTTQSGKNVSLEIYAAHGKQDRCWHAMASLKKSMRWDEERFGREYDLSQYMIVAIDDFNAGAMENKGLNIFNSRLVLADAQTATDQDFHAIESVVAHEYFHNWTGNRITLQSWFHLSLKEGLTVFRDQEFSADMGDRGLQRIQDVDSLRERQFPEDAGPNAHPVRPESCLAVDNFFTATIYEKGAELIRMMQTTVGRKGFRAGMDLYFSRYDGQAVTTDDFANAIADANNADFRELKKWYSQAGTPRVKVEESYNATQSKYTLHLQQFCPATPGQPHKEPFQIPLKLALIDQKTRQEIPLVCPDVRINSDGDPLIELKEKSQTFTFQNCRSKPVLSLLRDFSAPVILDWNRSEDDLFFLMSSDPDGFNRREASQQAARKALSAMIADIKDHKTPQLNSTFQSAWVSLLYTDLDEAYLATLLALPTEMSLVQSESVFHAEIFAKALDTATQTLAKASYELLLQRYQSIQSNLKNEIDTRSMGKRALKNFCLKLLATTQNEQALDLSQQLYNSATNMTDRLSALRNLVHYYPEAAPTNDALKKFHKEWHHDSVVLNKWFSVQATAPNVQTFKKVQELSQHPDFNPNNPNNVYSLLRAFGQNLSVFHRPDLTTYEFYTNWIAKLDQTNPGVAARLCSAFDVIQKLEPERQAVARKEIKKVLDQPNVSRNTRELLQNA